MDLLLIKKKSESIACSKRSVSSLGAARGTASEKNDRSSRYPELTERLEQTTKKEKQVNFRRLDLLPSFPGYH